jgi:hypothetical protein
MNPNRRQALVRLQRAVFLAGLAGVAVAEPSHAFFFGASVVKPAGQEFGFGPRESAQPQVQRSLGGGMYDIEGLRFTMGGWWELKLFIETPDASDRVTVHLEL